MCERSASESSPAVQDPNISFVSVWCADQQMSLSHLELRSNKQTPHGDSPSGLYSLASVGLFASVWPQQRLWTLLGKRVCKWMQTELQTTERTILAAKHLPWCKLDRRVFEMGELLSR
jgi:hypothetical protein